VRRAAAVLLALALGCSPKSPPAKAEKFFPEKVASPSAETFDAAALQVEYFLTQFAERLQQRAATDAALAFADDFEGTPPLAAEAGPFQPQALAGGAVCITKMYQVGPGRPREAIARFLARTPRVFSCRLKMPAMDFWERGVFGEVKLELNGVSGDKTFSIQEQFEAVLVLRDREWRFQKLRLTQRREVVASRPFVAEVGKAMGLEGHKECGPANLATPFEAVRGCASGDFDGDGWLDVVLVSPYEIRLFRNGQGARFVDVTKESGLRFMSPAAGVIAWDYDGDGDLDLAVSQCVWEKSPLGQPDPRAIVVWRNDGGMKFTDVTAGTGIVSNGPATALAAADVDRDGDLDLYVCMYGMHRPDAVPDLPLQARNGAANQLWINEGGKFIERGAKAGVADTGFSLACAFGDLEADGYPDLYVANDFGAHRLYRNRKDGTFEEVPSDSGFGMGVSWGDVDNDGDLDIYVSNMYSNAGKRVLRSEKEGLDREIYKKALKSAEGNSLFTNLGGKLSPSYASMGAGAAGWAWSNAFIDIDNDGRLDLYAVNGYISGLSKRDR
jgi:hypothetical protein